ncbi:MAG: alpha/beta hydrolase [Acidobacteria bacterium]|nr:alpha/beta hydrolase [Acidobacteriota bacterium]
MKCVLLLLGLSAFANEVIYLWPESERVPGKETIANERIASVPNPNLTVFFPEPGKANGAALVIAPGGGHHHLAIDHEGYDVARWLNKKGIAAFVLKYRLARAEGADGSITVDNQVRADGRRAVRIVRSRAKEWGIDPTRIGMIGFSAGGELAALTAMHFEPGKPDAVDPFERVASRPDFIALIYPNVRPETKKIGKDTPPAFLVHADDDRLSAAISTSFYLDLKKAGVSAELHVYSTGGHGFGVKDRPLPVTQWTVRFTDWLAAQKWIP